MRVRPGEGAGRRRCDVVTINCPLHEGTRGLFDRKLMSTMKPGSYLVNTARGAIVHRDDLVEMLESGHLAGYAGAWRLLPNH